MLLVQVIYRGSYIVAFFFVVWFLRAIRRRKVLLILWRGAVGGLFIWTRFIEPQQIRLQETTIDIGVDARVVLIADTHLGVYKDWVFLQKVVNQINRLEDIDMVLIAGDFTYEPLHEQRLEELFAPLNDLNVPVFAVLGNHDVQKPWPDLREDLWQALDTNNVTILNNDLVALSGFLLLWLGEHLNGEAEVRRLNTLHPLNKVVVLTHNPDVTLNYINHHADVTLVGHTHCGQIRLPFVFDALKKYIIPTKWSFDKWLTQEKYTQLFITCGLWEVILPMRWRNPPTIDVISFSK